MFLYIIIKSKMEITIFYDEHSISITVNKSVKVSTLLNELKHYFNEINAQFSIVDEDRKALSPKTVINPNKPKRELFLFKIASYPKQKENKDTTQIEKMIMNETKAKNLLKNVKYSKDSYDPKEIIDLEAKEDIEENNNNNLYGGNNDGINDSTNFNESNILTLRDMGFSEEQARNALIQARNNLNRATVILIQGNEVQEEDEEEPEDNYIQNQNNNNNIAQSAMI